MVAIIGICLMFIFSSGIQSDKGFQVKNRNFDVAISFDKSNEFKIEENVFINLKIKNVSNFKDSLRFLNEDDGYSMLSVYSEMGNKIQFKGLSSDQFESNEPYFILKPGETKLIPLDLFYAYGLNNENNPSYSNHFYYPPGNYSVRYAYQDLKNNLYFESNNLTFVVKEPDVNDSISLSKLKEIYKMPAAKHEDAIKKINSYKQFSKNYANSIYVKEALYYYAILSSHLRYYDQESIDIVNNFVDKYPESGYAGSIIWAGMDASYTLIGKTDARQFIDSINDRHYDSDLTMKILELKQSNFYLSNLK